LDMKSIALTCRRQVAVISPSVYAKAFPQASGLPALWLGGTGYKKRLEQNSSPTLGKRYAFSALKG
jgi:hypothetical protein